MLNSFITIIMVAIGIIIELLTVPYWGIAAVMLMIGYMAIYLVILYMIGEIKDKIKRGVIFPCVIMLTAVSK